MIRNIKIEEIYSNFKVIERLSNDDFILSPFFQLPLYDILKDDFCEFYGYFENDELVGICALRIIENYYQFPTYENVNPYQDFIVHNKHRKNFIVSILKDKKFILFPILEDSPTIKIISEQFEVKKEMFSKIYYLELPKMLDEIIYKSRKHDEIIKVLKKLSKQCEFKLINEFDFYDLFIKTKVYLLPQSFQIFISDLISICKTNNFLRIFTIENEFYFIVFVYKSKAYLWHYVIDDEKLKIFGFLKILESLILEQMKTLIIFTDFFDLDFPMKQKITYRIYKL